MNLLSFRWISSHDAVECASERRREGSARRAATLRASATANRHRSIVRAIHRASLLACLCSPAAAAPPENADPLFTPWYRSLRQPGTGAECRGLADCRIVEFRRNGDIYEVFVDERRRLTRPYWAR